MTVPQAAAGDAARARPGRAGHPGRRRCVLAARPVRGPASTRSARRADSGRPEPAVTGGSTKASSSSSRASLTVTCPHKGPWQCAQVPASIGEEPAQHGAPVFACEQNPLCGAVGVAHAQAHRETVELRFRQGVRAGLLQGSGSPSRRRALARGRVTPSTLTCRSSMASSKALWVRGWRG